MDWTYTAPTERGWYWKRCNRWKPSVVFVVSEGGRYVVLGAEEVLQAHADNGDQWWPVQLEPPPMMPDAIERLRSALRFCRDCLDDDEHEAREIIDAALGGKT